MLQWDSEKRCMQNVDKTYSFFTLFPEKKTIETFRGFFEVIFFFHWKQIPNGKSVFSFPFYVIPSEKHSCASRS